MQYLLNEVKGEGSVQTGEAKLFKSIPDIIKYLKKASLETKMMVGQEPLTESLLATLLKEKLSTAPISMVGNTARGWIVTAF